MIRQADNLARAIRARVELARRNGPSTGVYAEADAALDAALLAYDAARQDTLRLIAGAVPATDERPRAAIIMPGVSDVCASVEGMAGYESTRLAVADLARRIAASVNLLAHVPLDTLERLDTHSDAPAVLAAKVRGMEA